VSKKQQTDRGRPNPTRVLKQFLKHCGLAKIARCGFP
jgi:hypothetical protein